MSDVMAIRIVTPERVFYEGTAEMVIFQAVSGELGILPGHVPLTAVIDSTVFYLKEQMDQPQRFAAVHGGFVQVLPDRVTVVTNAAEWPEEIDEERARRAEERARQRLAEAEDGKADYRRAELALRRSLVRLQLKQQ